MTHYDGGYDDGYRAVACFWGLHPGSLVRQFLSKYPNGVGARVLDLGCGEGKNAAAFARAGYAVDAIDCSSFALTNGRRAFAEASIKWLEADARDFSFEPNIYDVVVAYGLFHCMRSLSEISLLIDRTKYATKCGGYHLICVFNDRSHDLRGHPRFLPTLASHQWYYNLYSNWIELSAVDCDLSEIHPHNRIPHHHSVTRLVARKPGETYMSD